MDNHHAIKDNLPLTETTYLIMLSLAGGPRHGYSIMKDVQAISGERVTLSTGTLYSTLKRLLDQEWIVRAPDPEPDDTQRVRKAYRLTELGQAVLALEVERLQELVRAAQARVLEDPSA